MAVPVIIVTGFLGCGKTSFLRHLLPLCGELGLRPALIVNEVGDVDVDGELLADLHAEQVRLVGGCVCCTLQSQLSDTVYDVLDRQQYNLIIIECSGLSNPIDVVSVLSAPAMLPLVAVSHIICLADAGRGDKALKATEIAKAQVSSADILILNKVDRVGVEQMPSVEDLFTGYAPNARVYWSTYGDIGLDAMSGILTSPAPVRCSCGCTGEHGHDHHHGHSHGLPASFCTVAVSLPDTAAKERIEALLASLPESVVRAKGFAHLDGDGWHVLHRVYDAASVTPLGGPAPKVGAVLICIGQHLSPEHLHDLCRVHLGADGFN